MTKDIVRKLTPLELQDIRNREQREGSPYSDRDMLLDHIYKLEQERDASVDHHTHYLALVEIRELKARIEVLEAELARDPFVRDGWQTPRASRIRALLSDEMRQQTQPLDVQL